jgi:hypothetical protein
MKRNLEEEGRIIQHSKGIGTVTRAMVLARARELALINGHSAAQVVQSDWEQAKRELLGEEGLVPTETPAEILPESERWDPTPVSTGHKIGERPPHDEQSDAERLTEQGLAEAEHDLMVEGTREGIRREREG